MGLVLIGFIVKKLANFLTMSFGKIPINFEAWGITYLTISGHKFYAPKGVGALNEFFYERKLP
jgi:hypothetical protein